MTKVQEAVNLILKQGYKPEEYQENKQDIAFLLLSAGYSEEVIAEAVLDFQWISATEEDYEATRQANARIAEELMEEVRQNDINRN